MWARQIVEPWDLSHSKVDGCVPQSQPVTLTIVWHVNPSEAELQGYLVHNETPTPGGPRESLGHMAAAGC